MNREYLNLERKWLQLQEDKDRLEALILHLEGEGSAIYDNAPQRGLFIEKSPCPPEFAEYSKKNSADILEDCRVSLSEIKENLIKIENKLKKLG